MPYRIRYGKPSDFQAMDTMDGEQDYGSSQALKRNFLERAEGRAVAKLRADMAARGFKVGSGAIQAARAGSLGMRLETLQKFADYFECSLIELLASPDQLAQTWPFKRLTPEQFVAASDEMREEAEAMLVRSAEKRSKGSRTETPASDTPLRKRA